MRNEHSQSNLVLTTMRTKSLAGGTAERIMGGCANRQGRAGCPFKDDQTRELVVIYRSVDDRMDGELRIRQPVICAGWEAFQLAGLGLGLAHKRRTGRDGVTTEERSQRQCHQLQGDRREMWPNMVSVARGRWAIKVGVSA